MSTPLPRHARRAARMAVVTVSALALSVPVAAGADTPPVSASAPRTPWTSVSDVLAASLERMQASGSEVTPAAEPAPEPEPAPTPRVLATVDGVELFEPAVDLVGIGFHEGSTHGLALSPVGHALVNDSWIDTPADADGPDYRIMRSRGREARATSAVDLAMAPDEVVHAVVTGTVVNVQPYSLYGKTPDVLIEISPDGHPELKVQVFHVEDVRVAVGDRVTAGETELAANPRQLPFPSQIDEYVGHPGPHVHVQVVRA